MLGDENALKETVEGLRSAEGYIRRCLARTVNLRNTPEITFIPDTSIAYAISMSKKIDDLRGAEEEDEPDETGSDAEDLPDSPGQD